VSHEVLVGDLAVGGAHPIAVQSMTNTKTMDTDATVRQVMELADAGCDIVRITAPSVKEAENLSLIRANLRKKGYHLPLVADIHFTPKPAEVAARIVEKVRINPGNYVDRNRGKTDWSEREIAEARERIAERLVPLLRICKAHGTAIRIGTNHGSLSERILAQFGNTPLGMVESAMEFVRICNDFGFHHLILSMKASNVKEMVAANILLAEQLTKEGFYYPIHLGVTEAGNGDEARIKSAAGIGSLLARGIGDTVRVSLAEDPVNEVGVGRKLVQHYGRQPGIVEQVFDSSEILLPVRPGTLKEFSGQKHPVVGSSLHEKMDLIAVEEDRSLLSTASGVSCKYSNPSITDHDDTQPEKIILKKSYQGLDDEDLKIRVAADFALLLKRWPKSGIWIDSNNEPGKLAELSLNILQALGLRYSKTEFIACPTCGRTRFNLIDAFNKVKARTAHLKGLQIAVMGCIVNGPGEMGDADYGYVGAGPGKVTIYKDGEAVHRNVDEYEAINTLIRLIKDNGDWSEPSGS
jgi:(E)-4-hydroxy-3-methylbut-2-enyl-diphosphate synthase